MAIFIKDYKGNLVNLDLVEIIEIKQGMEEKPNQVMVYFSKDHTHTLYIGTKGDCIRYIEDTQRLYK